MAKKYLDPKADVTFKKVSQDLLDNPQTGQALEIVRESAYSKEEMAAYDGFWDYVSRRREEVAEAESAARARDAALAERNAALAERNAALTERNAAQTERNAALTERNAALAERDAAVARVDAATARADAAMEKLRQDKQQTARNLKAMNLAIEQIAAATGLTVEEIDKL